ncbi:WD repeat and FYVE domain-containing protein 3-like [Ylistrum balloti]|uniref:WD repeat and FYVE domain-containing protein 3-like n=1 Tax=Ylistrum balloti TaxID=509963 RepID=UPI002905814D|nr:WD repeat and FYVE domain-containing protein 3-like [Ylistrum balloti]
MSQIIEWDSRNVIMTGSSDGVVRMWSIEYVQVPIENKSNKNDDRCDTTPVVEQVEAMGSEGVDIPKTSRKESCASYCDARAVVDRLRDFKDPDLTAREIEMGSSAESESHIPSHLRDSRCDLERDGSVISTTSSISDMCRADDIGSTDGAEVDPAQDALDIMYTSNISDTQIPCQSEPCLSALTVDGINYSQSHPDLKMGDEKEESNLSKSASSEFEVITDSEVKNSPKTMEDLLKRKPRKRNALREGFRWQRQLVFRSKLTMHTAYERKDNKDPAAVTAIAVSK